MDPLSLPEHRPCVNSGRRVQGLCVPRGTRHPVDTTVQGLSTHRGQGGKEALGHVGDPRDILWLNLPYGGLSRKD